MPKLNYPHLVDPVLLRLRAQVPEFAGMPAGGSVLDVCCGTGAQVYEYAARGMVAHGLDISPEMLGLARRNGAPQFKYQPTFHLADAACMLFKDNLFDYVSITLALHDKNAVLQDSIVGEMKRVVKKGGSLILVDYNAPAPRNIAGLLVRTIEFAAGGDYARNYSSYLKMAGLRGILSRHSLTAEKVRAIKSAVFCMVSCLPV